MSVTVLYLGGKGAFFGTQCSFDVVKIKEENSGHTKRHQQYVYTPTCRTDV